MKSVSEVKKSQDQFKEMLPEIEGKAAAAFSHLDAEKRDESVAETIGLCWKNYLHCVEEQWNPGASSLAYFGILSVRSGRKLAGSNSTDAMSRQAQQLRGFGVHNMNAVPVGTDSWDASEALQDRSVWSRPLDRVRVKMDYGDFLHSSQVTRREERVFSLLAAGERPIDIAEDLGVSPPRITQLKNALGRKLLDHFGPSVLHPPSPKIPPRSCVALG